MTGALGKFYPRRGNVFVKQSLLRTSGRIPKFKLGLKLSWARSRGGEY